MILLGIADSDGEAVGKALNEGAGLIDGASGDGTIVGKLLGFEDGL